MSSSNPALRHVEFQSDGSFDDGRIISQPNAMSLSGTIIKTGILLIITMVAAALTARAMLAGSAFAAPVYWGTAIGALVLSLVIGFVPKTAPFLAPLYALAEGAFLGWISLAYATRLGPGGDLLIVQAVSLTFGIFAAMLIAYATGLIRGGPRFTRIIMLATLGISLTYLASFLCNIFGLTIMAPLFGFGWIGVGFSLFVVGIASFKLICDFELVTNGIRNAAPKYMEWYAGFALLVTLVWLYIEILRLLAKLRRK